MEFWDLLDENRIPLHRAHPRGIPLPAGTFHAVAFVWVMDRSGEFLLMRRAPEKKSYAGCWGCTGGSVQAGESSRQGIRRELWEETGIDAREEAFQLLTTVRERGMFCDLYFLAVDRSRLQLRFQPGETVEAGWFTLAELARLPDLAEPDQRRLRLLGERLAQLAGIR